MDLSDTEYYRLNRHLLEAVGQWPYQNPRARVIRTSFITVILLSCIITQVCKMCTSYEDMDTVIEIFPPMITACTCTIKIHTSCMKRNQMKKMLERMSDDWKMLQLEEEEEILRRYAKLGKKFVVSYSVYIGMTATVFLLAGVTPQIMDVLIPLNESRARRQIYLAEYFVDDEKYFYAIFCHMSICGICVLASIVSVDGMFLAFTQHACGIFEIAGHRLEHSLYRNEVSRNLAARSRRDTLIRKLAIGVESHRRALDFVQLIESSYSISFLVQLVLNMVCMSVTLLQIAILMGKSKDVVRYAIFVSAQLFHIFCNSYPGQMIMDHSFRVLDRAYLGTWYDAPVFVQKMLVLVLRRSLNPCFLTAGKIYTLCLESFAAIVQTSMSYFMVLSSLR